MRLAKYRKITQPPNGNWAGFRALGGWTARLGAVRSVLASEPAIPCYASCHSTERMPNQFVSVRSRRRVPANPVARADNLRADTVAMLFMLDMDDLAYKFLLPQRWRLRMEVAGRVQLEDAEASLFARTGAVYAALLSITGPVVVMMIGNGEPSLWPWATSSSSSRAHLQGSQTASPQPPWRRTCAMPQRLWARRSLAM